MLTYVPYCAILFTSSKALSNSSYDVSLTLNCFIVIISEESQKPKGITQTSRKRFRLFDKEITVWKLMKISQLEFLRVRRD
jgi:hypothetical protein